MCQTAESGWRNPVFGAVGGVLLSGFAAVKPGERVLDLGTGTVQTVMNADTNSSLQYASEIRVWNGVCYDCYRALGQDIGAVLHTYALSDGEEHTTAVGDTSEITEAPVETPNIAWPVEEPAE